MIQINGNNTINIFFLSNFSYIDGKRILLGKGISIDKVRCTVEDFSIHEREITQNSLRFSVTKSV